MTNTAFLGVALGSEIVGLVEQTGLVAKAVLLILLIFSIFSWGIILSKWRFLKRARTQSGRCSVAPVWSDTSCTTFCGRTLFSALSRPVAEVRWRFASGPRRFWSPNLLSALGLSVPWR